MAATNKSGVKTIDRITQRANTTNALHGDPKFKKYTQQVEKCLATFESVHEWADFIAFLTKLLKTLQSYNQFKEIPRKLMVGKRLAQCLNPALPTGVHQRALDVFSHILAVLGPEGLKRDLQIWSTGLFPFLAYSATSVRPALLNLYDTYYLALKQDLRPLTKALILALLPGLEEENSESFDKVLGILDRLSASVTPAFFLQNVWLVLLTAPSARGAAVHFLTRRFPKLTDDIEVSSVVGRDIGLMIRSFAASLEDDDTLVRRGILEILNSSFRVDSKAFKSAQDDDQEIMMRAAVGVVLRRDLSLSRRLYTWLLGGDEASEMQLKFFQKNSQMLLRRTLLADMGNERGEVPDLRAYKIFLSLLDKWEIGSSLTEVLILDALKTISGQYETDGSKLGTDVLMTAGTLYEAVEPILMWRPLFLAIVHDLVGGQANENLHLLRFLVSSFRSHDDEILRVHLPLCLAALTELLHSITSRDKKWAQEGSLLCLTLRLLGAVVSLLPSAILFGALDISKSHTPIDEKTGPLGVAFQFYGADIPSSLTSAGNGSSIIPAEVALDFLIRISETCVETVIENDNKSSLAQSGLSETLIVIKKLVDKTKEPRPVPLSLSWDPQVWLGDTLRVLTLNVTFNVVDNVVATVMALSRCSQLKPRLFTDDRETVHSIITALSKYLQPQWTPYHVRAVQLIWLIEGETRYRHVEAVLAQGLTDSIPAARSDAFAAFGTLWRLTDDSLMPGFHFKIPLLLVIDTLKGDDVEQRRLGETWMRCCLKSYLRVLDPLMYDLIDPAIRRAPVAVQLNGRETRGYTYEYPIDQRRLQHVSDCLFSVVKFGGRSLSKIARATLIKKSVSPGFVSRVETARLLHESASYMEVLVHVLLRFIQTEPPPATSSIQLPGNIRLQASALDLLQALVTGREVDPLTLNDAEAAIIGKLYSTVHTVRLELQTKLLHTLHSVIIQPASYTPLVQGQPSSSMRLSHSGSIADDFGLETTVADKGRSSGANTSALLLQTVIDGLSITSNRPLLQHWVDFILMTIPEHPNLLSSTSTALCDCLCSQLRLCLSDLRRTYQGPPSTLDLQSSTSDAEIIMLMNALERLVLLSLRKADFLTTDDEASSLDKPTNETGGFLGLVSNVFAVEASPTADVPIDTRSAAWFCLDDAVRVLYAIWTDTTPPSITGPTNESASLVNARVHARSRKVLERLFRAQSTEVLESLIDSWDRIAILEPPAAQSDASFEMIDILTSSAQTAVHMVCESIASRASTMPERGRRSNINPNLSEVTIYAYLEEYFGHLEAPIAVQVWPRYVSLAKDIVASSSQKQQVFPALRCFVKLCDKIAQSAAFEDRRMRKDMQELLTKLTDTVVLLASRPSELAGWIRRGLKEGQGLSDKISTPISRVQSAVALNEKGEVMSSTSDERTVASNASDLANQITTFISSALLPNIKRFISEPDKIALLSSNIVYYLVSPSMKSRSRLLEVDPSAFGLLREMVKIPAAIKAWRTPINDAFNDNRFFNSIPAVNGQWQPLIRALMDSDKANVSELISRISTAPSANIFANREYEMLLRSLNLRRLSYVLFAGERNQYLTQLPAIQEKLVDFLRADNLSSIVISEVYLCLRILLCRLSPQNMTSFWPVILTELFRILGQCLTTPPTDGSDDLIVLLAACRFLDLVLVLQTEEFTVHEWMFVTDTVDAVYPPEKWIPEAVMDQLAEVIGDLPDIRGHAGQSVELMEPHTSVLGRQTKDGVVAAAPRSAYLRRPLLSSIRSIESIKDLVPFFSHVSLFTYESVYGSSVYSLGHGGTSSGSFASVGAVDWEAIERSLIEDMFEGR